MTINNPFHQGELDLQCLAGEQLNAARLSQMIQPVIPAAALKFVSQQSFIWIGIEDRDKMIWACVLTGSPGFMNTNSGELLEITLDENRPVPDHWFDMLEAGKFIGCLLIELETRRRLRVNGVIKTINKRQLHITVQHAYPNCPKYIRRRELLGKPVLSTVNFINSGSDLNEQLINIIRHSDTSFVASVGPNGADVSHRGGPSGFIRCESNTKITVPDYQGNGLFNSLGNFKVNPVGGILVVDFEKGYFLQLSGAINIVLDTDYPNVATNGTHRYWQMDIQQWQLFQLSPNTSWETLEYSPYNP